MLSGGCFELLRRLERDADVCIMGAPSAHTRSVPVLGNLPMPVTESRRDRRHIVKDCTEGGSAPTPAHVVG